MKCFDTYALVAMLHGNPAYAKYVHEDFFIPDTTLAEFSRVLLKAKSREIYDIWVSQLEPYARPVDLDLLLNAMEFRNSHPKKDFSFFDAVGFASAIRERCPFVTGDEAFKGMENVEFVKEAR
jgi:predicted nucleic acid-binding protein